MVLGLFGHTDQGSRALKDLLTGGTGTEQIAVVGDLGIPAGQAGAMHHATLDELHVPSAQRSRFMEGIREGSVVLAVRGSADGVEDLLRRAGAVLVEWTDETAAAVSHNTTR